ncbi:MAG: putative ABC transport system permease protein [Flavobacteriales bacterium]|jgi:putative ABC transport system permease protein
MHSISWFALLWCAVPLVLMLAIYYFWLGCISEVLIASTRMIVQLLLIGYILLFLFDQVSLLVTLGVMLIMLVASAWIALRPLPEKISILPSAMLAIGLSVLVHLLISLLLVIKLEPWYSPRIAIPLAGMYFSTAMNTVSLVAERFHVEYPKNDLPNARKQAFNSAMIPQINGLLAVGLVALPGMMTGQILSGVSPLVAVRYQIMIMSMVFGCGGIAAAIFLWRYGVLMGKNNPR